MFFIGIFGNDSKVVPAGQISVERCPVCGNGAPLHVCRRYSYFHAFFIPLVKYDSCYLATCPGCASVFELDPAVGARCAKDRTAHADASALHLLKSNHFPRCPGCGSQQPEGSLFCNQCGAKL